MSLPKIKLPTYTAMLPITQKEITYRSFTHKEEKNLLLAAQSEDEKEYSQALLQLVNNCILDADIDVTTLPSIDVEYVFIQLRIRSNGEIVSPIFAGLKRDCEECQKEQTLEVNLNDIEVTIPDGHTNIVQLTDDITLKMKYPTLKIAMQINDDVHSSTNLISGCIEEIVNGETVTDPRDENPDELMDWLDSLSKEHFHNIDLFFDTMPNICYETTTKCKECNYVRQYKIEGIQNFFV